MGSDENVNNDPVDKHLAARYARSCEMSLYDRKHGIEGCELCGHLVEPGSSCPCGWVENEPVFDPGIPQDAYDLAVAGAVIDDG